MTTGVPPSPASEPGPRTTSRMDSDDPVREDFFLLLLRSYERSKLAGNGIGAYLGIARTLTQMCAERWVRRFVFSAETQLIRRFLTDTRMPVSDPKRVIRDSLVVHALARSFGPSLGNLDRQEFLEICAVTGKEHLDAAIATGRGVIVLHTHTVLGELFWNWLDHAGIERGLTLWQWTFSKDEATLKDQSLSTIESARELHTALGILHAGGLVHSMADGQEGKHKIDLANYNRVRPYFTGFAALAVRANATVVTANTFVGNDGRLSIVVGPPIEANVAALDADQRIVDLVEQYAKHHEKIWQERPENIPWLHMRRHLRFPEYRRNLANIDEHLFIDKNDYASVMREIDPEIRIKKVFAYVTNRRKEELTVGDSIPQTILWNIDGSGQFKLTLNDKRPLILLFGAHSCPPFRDSIGEWQKMCDQCQGSADFLIVYTEEPHPIGGWQPPPNVTNRIAIPQHESISERLATAQRFAESHNIRVPIGVDTMENGASIAFAAWPVRIYILDGDNRIHFRGGRGPHDFRLSDARAALKKLLAKAERG